MKRKIIWLVALLLVGYALFATLAKPEVVQVSVRNVELGSVEDTVANTRAGTVKACLRSKMSMPIGGQIEQVLVKEGDQVEKGQLLMVLWNRDRKARLEQTRAQQTSIKSERQSVCVTAESDARELVRQESLYKRGLISSELLDRTETKARASKFACAAAQAREEEMAAALAVAEASLEQTYLYAPFAGQVATVTGEVGEFSTPSPPGVPTLPAIDLLTHNCHYVTAPIDEVDAASIRPGMEVRIILDAFKNRNFNGVVKRVAPFVLDREKQARTVDVEVDFDSDTLADTGLLAGYSADVEIILKRKDKVLKVPTEVILEGNRVMYIDADGILQKKQIQTGIANWRETEVVSGLSQGEELVSSLGRPEVVVGNPAEAVRE